MVNPTDPAYPIRRWYRNIDEETCHTGMTIRQAYKMAVMSNGALFVAFAEEYGRGLDEFDQFCAREADRAIAEDAKYEAKMKERDDA